MYRHGSFGFLFRKLCCLEVSSLGSRLESTACICCRRRLTCLLRCSRRSSSIRRSRPRRCRGALGGSLWQCHRRSDCPGYIFWLGCFCPDSGCLSSMVHSDLAPCPTRSGSGQGNFHSQEWIQRPHRRIQFQSTEREEGQDEAVGANVEQET